MFLSGAWSEKTHATSRRKPWYIDSSMSQGSSSSSHHVAAPHILKFINFKKSIFKPIHVAQILTGRCLLSPTGAVLAVNIVYSKLSDLQVQSRWLERILLDGAKRQLKAKWNWMLERKKFLCTRQDIGYEISYDCDSVTTICCDLKVQQLSRKNAQACHPTSKCFHMHPLMTCRQIRRTAGVTVVVQGHQQLWPLTMLQCNVISTLRRSATWCGWKDSFTWHVLGQCWLYCAKWFWQPHLRKRHVWCMGLLCKCRLQEPPEHYETLWAVVSRQSRTFVTRSAWLSSCLNLAKMTSAFGLEITEQTSKNRGVAIVKSQNRTFERWTNWLWKQVACSDNIKVLRTNVVAPAPGIANLPGNSQNGRC